MDPQATLRRIIDAARDNDREEYIAACEDLAAYTDMAELDAAWDAIVAEHRSDDGDA